MEHHRLPLPTHDFVFKKLFGENLTILESFLEAVLDLPAEEYQQLTVIDPNLRRDFHQDKQGILDIKLTTQSGKIIDIEVQVQTQKYLWNRIKYYGSKMVTEQVQIGHSYERIYQVISILIVDFVLREEKAGYHSCFRCSDKIQGGDYPDSTEIHLLELPKCRGPDGTSLGNWMCFFNIKSEEDRMAIEKVDPAIGKACGIIKVLTGDEQARAEIEADEKFRMDKAAWLSSAREDGLQEGVQKGLQEGRQEGRQEGLQEGRQEGLQKGRQEERQSVARNLLRSHIPYNVIVNATGLSFDEVKRLATDLGFG